MNGSTMSIQDPFEHIREDHRKVRGLMEEIVDAEPDDIAARREFFPQVREALILHSELEENVLYPALREVDSFESEMVDEALDDHKEMAALIRELSDMDESGEDWADRFEELRDSVEEHVLEEETDILPIAEQAMSAEKKEELRTAMQRFLQNVTTTAT